MSKNILRLKKGETYPNQDLLEATMGDFLNGSSLGKCYTEDWAKIQLFEKEKKTGGYNCNKGEGIYLLEDDYEIIVRKVSKNRLETESKARVDKLLKDYS